MGLLDKAADTVNNLVIIAFGLFMLGVCAFGGWIVFEIAAS